MKDHYKHYNYYKLQHDENLKKLIKFQENQE